MHNSRAKNFIFDCSFASALLLAAAVLYAILRVQNLAALDFWNDEIFTVNAIGGTWRQMFAAILDDRVHPPLFYVLLKIWADSFAGKSIFWLRLFSVACAVLTVFPFVKLCAELRLARGATATAMLLAAANFYLIRYAQELRMYGLLLFFAVCSLWLFARWSNERQDSNKNFAWLFVVNLLLVYTHYFGWLLVGCEAFYALLRSRAEFRRFLRGVAVLILCFAPWAFAVAGKIAEKRGVENLSWLQTPTFADLIGFYATLNGTFAVPRIVVAHLALFGGLVIWASLRVFARRDKDAIEARRMLVVFAFLPVAAVFAVSFKFPVWDYRYLIVAAAPYLILLAQSAAEFDSKIVRVCASIFVAAWALVSCFYNLNKPHQRIEWRALAAQIGNAETAATANVYVFEPWTRAPLKFYLDKFAENRFQVVQIENQNEIKDNAFWLAIRDAESTLDQPPAEFWRQRNCRVGFEKTFPEQQQSVLLLKVEDCR